MNSGKNIEIQGKIISLARGGLVTLLIESGTIQQMVDIPVKIDSDFELIPFKPLIGAEVKYSKKYERVQEETLIDWKLEVLSGLYKGDVYSAFQNIIK